MYNNNLYAIEAEKYNITKESEINIFTVKPEHLEKNINNSEYKIIFKFKKNVDINLKIGISVNLKKIKCKFNNYEYEFNTVMHFKFGIKKDNEIELEIEDLKKYFEIYVKIDYIDSINNLNEIITYKNNKIHYLYSENENKLLNIDIKNIDNNSQDINFDDLTSITNNTNDKFDDNNYQEKINFDDLTSISNDCSNEFKKKKNIFEKNIENSNSIKIGKIIDCSKSYNEKLDNKIKKIIIVLSKFIKSIGDFFKLIFEARGYECEIVFSLDLTDCLESTPNEIYLLVYTSEEHLAVPSRYIYYQVEQSNSIFLQNTKLLKKIIYMMRKAEQVWEYNTISSFIYSKYCEKKLKWVPIPYYYIENTNNIDFDSCEYDIFFFGHPNERRKNIMNILSKYFKVKVGWGYYDEKKIKYIKKSKIILNLHFYKDSGLETCRINEILNYNKVIVSESSLLDIANTELYSDLVIFVDEIDENLSNIKKLVKTIKYYLDKSNYIEKLIVDKKKLSNKINNLIEI